ncbi:DUF2460 domain-containing protein [Palleronia sp. LCG004]|uniref:DUF2460 domain-containing protein n=1 Tax=Palleronia sp. LCG004 TaxID=3079304 RepID=UPI002943B230|nr:DUF2460 domain-containing protein [Palleronia sp. LCG004]WOI55007.1 DUF2460 domain-containing protein [Palleronia sp. LCG004]
MSFHDVRFPTDLSFGAIGGPERRTEIVTLANGFEERNTPWAHSRRRFDAGLGLRSLEDIEKVIAFFEARRGQLHGFRWKDWSDFRSCPAGSEIASDDQQIGIADGTTREFQLTKAYGEGDAAYVRPIQKPVAGSVRIGIDGERLEVGEGHSVDFETGRVLFDAAPKAGAKITAGFEFDIPVRFDTDRIATSIATFQAGEIPDIPVVEVRI